MGRQAVKLPRHFVVAVTGWLSRIITAFAQIIVIRLVIEYLGQEAYAVFALLVGLTTWFTLAELGIGFSVQNFISEQRAGGHDPRVYVYVGLVLSAIALGGIGIAVLIAAPILGPAYLTSATLWSATDKAWLFGVASVSLAGAALGSTAYKVWYGEQRGYLANISMALASVIGVAGAYTVVTSEYENRLLLAIAAFLTPTAILPQVIILVRIVASVGKCKFNPVLALSILRRGFGFWVFAVLSVCVLNIDYLVLSQLVDTSDIAKYAIIQKVFGFLLAIYGAVLIALWPEFAELWIKKRHDEIRRMLRRYITAGLIATSLFGAIFAVFRDHASRLVSGGEGLGLPAALIILMTVYCLLRIWTDTYAMALQSASDLRPFWCWVPVQACISVVAQISLGYKYGAYGVVLGLILSFLGTVAWVLPRAVVSRCTASVYE